MGVLKHIFSRLITENRAIMMMLRENFPLDSPDHNAYHNKAVGLHVNCFIFIFVLFSSTLHSCNTFQRLRTIHKTPNYRFLLGY